nr:MAG TPA: hypothetical protein [Bacteriophage sp.]DAW45138.1 MAG TPA: hypothetical protein [Bacteriophage sp.]
MILLILILTIILVRNHLKEKFRINLQKRLLRNLIFKRKRSLF